MLLLLVVLAMAAALVGLASLALVAFWFGPVGALIAALAGFTVLYGVGGDGRRLATGRRRQVSALPTRRPDTYRL